MSTRAYPKYKDSGVEWLGKVPEHWEVSPIFALFCERGETNEGMKTENVLSVMKDIGVINYEEKGDVGNKKSEDIERYKIVKTGDLVINSMNVIIGSAGIAPEDGALSPVYLVLQPRVAAHMPFYGHVFRCRGFQRSLTRIGYGILEHRMRIPMVNLKRERLPLPPLPEQRAIADFLDREYSRLETLISRQERLIELSLEKRRALIGHAVTRGLDESAPLKDSGVEWLGEVPQHWEIWRLSHACSHIGSGTTPPSDETKWYQGTVAWVTTGELRENIITETQKQVSEEALNEFSSLKKHPAGSVVMAMYGATIGRLGLLGIEATCNQACCVLSGSRVLAAHFLYYWLFGFREEIVSLAVGGGQPNINQEIITRLKVPLPSISEQRAIVAYLDVETAKIDTLIAKARRAVELMKEHRSSLIAAAVTGQIDVREYSQA